GLEALQGQRAQVHGYEAVSASLSSALSAAACSALFLVLPSPRPISSPETSATATKLRSCGGPCSESIRYTTTSARLASRSWSTDLKSTGCSSASSTCSAKAATTAGATRSKPKARYVAPITASQMEAR